MRNYFVFLMVCTVVSAPDTAVAQRRCDGGGKLTSYVSGTIDGPTPSAIAEVWLNGGVPADADQASVAALGKAIEAFEEQRPSAERAAEIAAGDWTGWRAGLMSRDEFVRGFLDEVERRAGTQGDYAAILEAAQAMRNRLDNMNGAAGTRDRPEDPYVMWLWDLNLRLPGAEREIARLKTLPDGEWLWGRYTIGRKTAIACALDDLSPLTVVAGVVDRSLFRQPDVVATLVAGRKLPLGFSNMAYLYGLLEYRLPNCKWSGSVDGLASVVRFQQAATQSSLTRSFELSGVVVNSVDFATNAKDGRADAEALEEKYGCDSAVAVGFAKGLVRTVQIDATGSSDSLFVQSCSKQGLSLKQCGCLAELGRGVTPEIEKMGYDSRSTIRWMVGRNPILLSQIGLQCGINNY